MGGYDSAPASPRRAPPRRAGSAMQRLAPALLGRLARARPWAPVPRRGAAAGASSDEEQFVFLEYEPELSEAVAAAPRRDRDQDRDRGRGQGRQRREWAPVGRPDPSVPPSGVSCSGCGAELQCRDGAAPGFVPAEKYRSLCEGPAGAEGLRAAVCQRCWLLAHQGRALRLELPPEQHRRVLSAALRRPPRHGRGPLLLYLLDLLELPDPVLPQLPGLLGPDVPVAGLLVVGNKVDLLPADAPGHLGRLRQRVAAACARAGLRGAPLVDVRLVSAKTGFGLEGLVSRLQRSWKCAGDVYLLGATNSGKSTLFNSLLLSDYCKSRAPDIIDRATVSPWPGQRCCSPRPGGARRPAGPGSPAGPWGRGACHRTGGRCGQRAPRLCCSSGRRPPPPQGSRGGGAHGGRCAPLAAGAGEPACLLPLQGGRDPICMPRHPPVGEGCPPVERETQRWAGTTLNLLKFPIINPTCDRIFRRQERLKEEATKTEDQLSSEEKKYLNHLKKQGYLVGRVGRTFQQKKSSPVVDFDPDMLSYSIDEDPKHSPGQREERKEFTHNELKDARWCFDTPGIIKENCVLNLLTEKEVKLVLPTVAIVPRTFILKPGMVLFLAALGRVDYLQGEKPAWFSVVASNLLPVHIATLSNADAIYEKHAGQELLKVPMGGEERMKKFPPLVPQDITLKGIGTSEAVADIKLSSAGWVAVTAHAEEELLLRAYTPKGTALVVREPPLLPYISAIRGSRIAGTAAYRTKKPPSLVENLKATGKR